MAARKRQPSKKTLTNVTRILKRLAEVNQNLKDAQIEVAADLQDVLGKLAGQPFASHEEAVETTRMIQEMMRQLGLRARCPNTEEACNLRCTLVRNKTTTFQFERFHERKRQVTAASTVFPDVELVKAPPDRRRKNRE